MKLCLRFRIRIAFASLSFSAALVSGHAQLIASRQVADLNPGSAGSYPTNFATFAGSLYFSASNPTVGRELWRYEGTNVNLVTNINDQVTDLGGGVFMGNDSTPNWLTVFNGALYFSAYDARRGDELWRFAGTNAVRVADINPDANDTIKASPNNSFPNQLTVLGNELFFSADGGGSKPNYELWKYNGVSAIRVANIRADSGSDFSSYPTGLTAFNGALYFMATDGANGYELWKSTGNNAVLLANINPGGASSDSFPQHFTPFNGRLYFSAFNSSTGYELWSTDGTNTSLVKDLNSGINSSYPEFLTLFNNALYFQANDGTNGYELWKYDGAAMTLVSNINLAADSFPKNLIVFQNGLYFSADDGIHGWELWRYDGTNAALVADVNPVGDSFPERLVPFGGALYFVATTPDTGYEWWRCDGTTVTLAAEINPGPGDSFPLAPAILGDELCFSATDDGQTNWELWSLQSIALRITSLIASGNDMQISWITVGGYTNVVQAAGTVDGVFTNLSEPIIVPGTDVVSTNYLDAGATLVAPARFYRVETIGR